jgi:hypothetical protein
MLGVQESCCSIGKAKAQILKFCRWIKAQTSHKLSGKACGELEDQSVHRLTIIFA